MQYPFFRGEAHHQLGSYMLSCFYTEKMCSCKQHLTLAQVSSQQRHTKTSSIVLHVDIEERAGTFQFMGLIAFAKSSRICAGGDGKAGEFRQATDGLL